MRDSHIRSWVKSVVWRIIGIVILPLIIWLVYKAIGSDVGTVALWSTIIFHTIRVVLYYYHERFWEQIAWGRKAVVDELHG